MSSFPVTGARFRKLEQTDDEENSPIVSGVAPLAALGIYDLQDEAEIENVSIRPSLEYGVDDFNRPMPSAERMETDLRIPSLGASLVQDGLLENKPKSTYRKSFAMSLLSTVLSGLYLVIGIWGPVWPQIRNHGLITPTFAKVISSVIEKLITISFGATCVLFLGQTLTRRSISLESQDGVSLAQLGVRNWIIDPGSMISDAKTLPLGTKSWLGWFTLIATLISALCGAATTALIQPILRDAPAQRINITGTVYTKFGNEWYLEKSSMCSGVSEEFRKGNCMGIYHSARGSYSYSNYLTAWHDIVSSGNKSTTQQGRITPKMPENGTWIEGSWVNDNYTKDSSGRLINGVTLAIPHPGVLQAANQSAKSIPQPSDFDGLGRYTLRASVPSPYIDVLCANVTGEDISALVYEGQQGVQLNSTSDLDTAWLGKFDWDAFASVKTPLDLIFYWNERRRPPVFYRYPIPGQTVLNITLGDTYTPSRQDSAYLLGSSGSLSNKGSYFLCSMRAGLLPNCSTTLYGSANASSMTAHCGEKNDEMSYSKRNPSAQNTTSKDWAAVASLATKSVALNQGETLGYADNPLLLSYLGLSMSELQPSLAETLSSILMPALILAARDSPLGEPWNQAGNYSDAGYNESFPIELKSMLYISGGTNVYKQLFIIVFAILFAMNIFMFCHLFVRWHNEGLIIDICDPMNLFGIALRGSFGNFIDSKEILSPKGPKIRPLSREWKILDDKGKMVIKEVDDGESSWGSPNNSARGSGFSSLLSPSEWRTWRHGRG